MTSEHKQKSDGILEERNLALQMMGFQARMMVFLKKPLVRLGLYANETLLNNIAQGLRQKKAQLERETSAQYQEQMSPITISLVEQRDLIARIEEMKQTILSIPLEAPPPHVTHASHIDLSDSD